MSGNRIHSIPINPNSQVQYPIPVNFYTPKPKPTPEPLIVISEMKEHKNTSGSSDLLEKNPISDSFLSSDLFLSSEPFLNTLLIHKGNEQSVANSTISPSSLRPTSYPQLNLNPILKTNQRPVSLVSTPNPNPLLKTNERPVSLVSSPKPTSIPDSNSNQPIPYVFMFTEPIETPTESPRTSKRTSSLSTFLMNSKHISNRQSNLKITITPPINDEPCHLDSIKKQVSTFNPKSMNGLLYIKFIQTILSLCNMISFILSFTFESYGLFNQIYVYMIPSLFGIYWMALTFSIKLKTKLLFNRLLSLRIELVICFLVLGMIVLEFIYLNGVSDKYAMRIVYGNQNVFIVYSPELPVNVFVARIVCICIGGLQVFLGVWSMLLI